MTDPVFEITKAATFDAAHHFPNEPDGSPYRRMHGHSFQVEVSVKGRALDANGWVADLGRLEAAVKAAASELDHGLLNDHEGLERPTLEHLCLWFAARLEAEWPGLSRVVVSRPTIHERCELRL